MAKRLERSPFQPVLLCGKLGRGSRCELASFSKSWRVRSECQNCQLSKDGTLLITVPYRLQSEFGDPIKAKNGKTRYCITISNIKFVYGQEDINYALGHSQSISYRFIRCESKWYLHATADRIEVPINTYKSSGALGIDLNPGVVGWAVCAPDGNLSAKGQFYLNIQDKSNEQTEAVLGDIVKQLVEIASNRRVPIALEELDFRKKKASMREQGVRYSRMLSSFAYKKFYKMLISRASRYGVEVIKTNPAYSYQIGLVKFMSFYGLSSDTAAALVLARRVLGHSERCPANYARFGQRKRSNLWPASSEGGWGLAQKKRHVWSTWAALSKAVTNASKKLNKRIRRHDYFARRGTNSPVVVTLLKVQASSSKSQSKRKSKTKTLPQAGEIPATRTASNTARLA